MPWATAAWGFSDDGGVDVRHPPPSGSRVRRLFLQVIDLERADRERAVREASADNPAVTEAVLSLLAGHDQEHGPLDRLVSDFGAPFRALAREARDPGERIGAPPGERYRPIRELGRGGMGVVRLAHDTSLNRLVAIKTLEPAIARSAEARRQLLREARTVAALDHPNVVTIHEIGVDEQGALFLVLAYSEGESLKSRLARGTRPSVDEAVRIAQDVAHALEAAHREGIIHRDVKPSNILLSSDGSVKLTDFGIAGHQREDGGFGRRAAGTPAYMSPEQRQGGPIDQRTDLWSLGSVLHEILTGLRYVPGRNEPRIDEDSIDADPPRRAALKAILERALHPDPARRYEGAAQMRVDLERLARPSTRVEGARWKRTGAAAAAVALSLAVTSEVPAGRGEIPVGPGQAGHVLWVDDDPATTREEATRLTEAGFRVTRALTTAQALELYAPAAFDLVISDVGRMEEEGYNPRAGLDLLSRLRAVDSHASIVFFTSGGAVRAWRERALADGALGMTSRSAELYELVHRRP